jgi:hypothetical protein
MYIKDSDSSHTSTYAASMESSGSVSLDRKTAGGSSTNMLEDALIRTPRSAAGTENRELSPASLPVNWSARRKWYNLLLISTLTLLT